MISEMSRAQMSLLGLDDGHDPYDPNSSIPTSMASNSSVCAYINIIGFQFSKTRDWRSKAFSLETILNEEKIDVTYEFFKPLDLSESWELFTV